FLGATFVYAGIDKLVDPAFLQATGPGSIGSQLESFVRGSRSGPLVHLFGQPFPVEIGLLIAVAEIAIGLGALSGLLFRLSAAVGSALSILFWLTASWATKPYYYGPDLPYAFGWLTLALAGTPRRFTIEALMPRGADDTGDDARCAPERRRARKAGLLGIAALAVAGLAGTVGASVLCRPKSGVGDATPTFDPNGIALDPSASTQPLAAGEGSSAATGAGGAASTPA